MAESGVYIIENLTKGMYINSLVIFREYIQNSCDAIDKARADKILSEDAGTVEIKINIAERRITIEDDGTGISVLDFKSTLTDIGYSDKNLETDRGFRGIGRLCGLSFCRELRFISTAKGEGIQSTVIFDAAKLSDIFSSKKKYSLKEALEEITSFETVATDTDKHFFRVELIDIAETNKDLLDVDKVRDYLSFVAPVTYSPNFYYQTEIYKHAKGLNFKITEYKILVNGEPLDKPYKINVRTRNGKDEIFGLDFQEFYNGEKLIAWSWIGLSSFRGVLDQTSGTSDNKMRGIRLRAGNIQIGDENALRDLFKEDRGTTYFIGEVHVVDKNLIPNGRRDYFEENDTCNALKNALRNYFAELHNIYHVASDIRGFYSKINKPAEAEHDFQKGRSKFNNRAKLEDELEILNKAATDANNRLASMRQKAEKNPDDPLSRVVQRMTNSIINPPPPSQPPPPPYETKPFPPSTWRGDLRKLYSEIKGVILNNPKLKGKELLDKIEEELTK